MEISIKGNDLALSVALGKGEPSSSGKSTVLYSTHGFQRIGNDLQVSLSVIRSTPKFTDTIKVVAPKS